MYVGWLNSDVWHRELLSTPCEKPWRKRIWRRMRVYNTVHHLYVNHFFKATVIKAVWYWSSGGSELKNLSAHTGDTVWSLVLEEPPMPRTTIPMPQLIEAHAETEEALAPEPVLCNENDGSVVLTRQPESRTCSLQLRRPVRSNEGPVQPHVSQQIL